MLRDYSTTFTSFHRHIPPSFSLPRSLSLSLKLAPQNHEANCTKPLSTPPVAQISGVLFSLLFSLRTRFIYFLTLCHVSSTPFDPNSLELHECQTYETEIYTYTYTYMYTLYIYSKEFLVYIYI